MDCACGANVTIRNFFAANTNNDNTEKRKKEKLKFMNDIERISKNPRKTRSASLTAGGRPSLRTILSPLPRGEGRAARIICACCNFLCTGVFLASALLSRDLSALLAALGGVALSLLPAAVQFFGASVPFGIWSLYELFLFGAMFLGERMDFYTKVPLWDVGLHAVSGFCFAAIGLSLYRPLFAATGGQRERFWGAVAWMLCFACTVGVLWEFVEFAFDRILYTDMQRDTVLSTIASRQIENGKKLHDIDMTVHGVSMDGYLDLGLQDTMTDQLAAAAGSLVFAVVYGLCHHHLSGVNGNDTTHGYEKELPLGREQNETEGIHPTQDHPKQTSKPEQTGTTRKPEQREVTNETYLAGHGKHEKMKQIRKMTGGDPQGQANERYETDDMKQIDKMGETDKVTTGKTERIGNKDRSKNQSGTAASGNSKKAKKNGAVELFVIRS